MKMANVAMMVFLNFLICSVTPGCIVFADVRDIVQFNFFLNRSFGFEHEQYLCHRAQTPI